MSAMLKYAACMRAHGITNYPDPSVNSHQIGFNLTGTGIDLNAPKVKAASKTCQPFSPFPAMTSQPSPPQQAQPITAGLFRPATRATD
jgi:hypothetical protein